jgi:hypothetical protein
MTLDDLQALDVAGRGMRAAAHRGGPDDGTWEAASTAAELLRRTGGA